MIRSLTPGEVTLGREAFGDSLAYDAIRLLASPFNRAFVAGCWFRRDWIVWPKRSLPEDVSEASLGLQALLIHELTHVWQARRGVNLLLAKIRAGDSPASYAYPLAADCRWEQMNIEQQATLVEHRFRLSRGLPVPADRAFYQRVCPINRS
ncbi:MAG: hypothetical protein REJ23_14030 [Brevundimonas sp.]|nr:hypothetical protein [Brevundimonas sp.]